MAFNNNLGLTKYLYCLLYFAEQREIFRRYDCLANREFKRGESNIESTFLSENFSLSSSKKFLRLVKKLAEFLLRFEATFLNFEMRQFCIEFSNLSL